MFAERRDFIGATETLLGAKRLAKKNEDNLGRVPFIYNKEDKTIAVFIPDGRMKPSGTRGKAIYRFDVYGVDRDGVECCGWLKATCLENALKQIRTHLVDDVDWDRERLKREYAYLKRKD